MLLLTFAGCGSVAAGTPASTTTSATSTLSEPASTIELSPASFADRAGWNSGASSEPGEPVEETFTWASTTAFRDVAFSAPPHDTLAAMEPGDLLIEVFLWRPGPDDGPITDHPAIGLPPQLDGNEPGQDFPGGDGSRWFQRTGGRVGNRVIDAWVFAGRPDPSAAQVASAQAMLDTLSLPDWPPG